MNNINFNKETEADKTIDLLFRKDEKTLEPDPYFSARVMAFIDERKEFLFLEKFRLNYLIPITLFIIILFNVFTFFIKTNSIDGEYKENTDIKEVIINEYYQSEY